MQAEFNLTIKIVYVCEHIYKVSVYTGGRFPDIITFACPKETPVFEPAIGWQISGLVREKITQLIKQLQENGNNVLK